MTKTIKITDATHQHLDELKKEMDLNTFDQVITSLIMTNEKYKNSTIVRLVKE